MSLTITATAGSATANSFATEAEAQAYMDARLNSSAWTGTEAKKAALIEATLELSLLAWRGTRVTTTQALSWPRKWAINPDSPSPVDPLDPTVPAYYAETEIPERIKRATAELALEFLRAGTADVAGLDSTLNVIRKKIDVLETEYVSPTQRAQGLARYPRVMALIARLLDPAAVGGLSIVRT